MRRDAYTLIEMLVVLVIMGLAAGLVAPMLLRPTTYDRQRQLTAVCSTARNSAATHGEVIYVVRIEPTGEWHMEGGGLPVEGDVARGRNGPTLAVPTDADRVADRQLPRFDVGSTAAAAAIVRARPADLRVKAQRSARCCPTDEITQAAKARRWFPVHDVSVFAFAAGLPVAAQGREIERRRGCAPQGSMQM